MKKRLCYFFVLAVLATAAVEQTAAQTPTDEQSYINVANKRAEKIVSTLNIKDPAKAARVTRIIASRYCDLNAWQTDEEQKISAAKKANADDAAALKTQIASFKKDEEAKVDSSHAGYVEALSKELSPEQVNKVKDGMTYNVLPITYKGYQEMIPNLTEKQKAQILAWLTEAREHAIDAGSSKDKHAWFGKYKGRINNYLSAQGYDLKKEGEDWQRRRDSANAAQGK